MVVVTRDFDWYTWILRKMGIWESLQNINPRIHPKVIGLIKAAVNKNEWTQICELAMLEDVGCSVIHSKPQKRQVWEEKTSDIGSVLNMGFQHFQVRFFQLSVGLRTIFVANRLFPQSLRMMIRWSHNYTACGQQRPILTMTEHACIKFIVLFLTYLFLRIIGKMSCLTINVNVKKHTQSKMSLHIVNPKAMFPFIIS